MVVVVVVVVVVLIVGSFWLSVMLVRVIGFFLVVGCLLLVFVY